MKIAVIGCGFVGGTVADFLEEHTAKDGVEVIRIDPKIPDAPAIEDVTELDAAILCLNAPTYFEGPNVGKVDESVTKTYIYHINKTYGEDTPILLKSTIPLLSSIDVGSPKDPIPNNVVYNPEFLRADFAEEDFLKQEHFILGIDPNEITLDCPPEENSHAKFWTNLFAPSLPNTEFIYTDRETAIMVKYTHNAWLATKIAFFHELSVKMPGRANYDKMTDILAKFPNIGPSHMKVPNAEGSLGYGGYCFPKDMLAFETITDMHMARCVMDTNDGLKKRLANYTTHLDYYTSRIPQEDFIVCIGTSHTFGECMGESIKSWTEFVEEQIGLKVINIGISGATNHELVNCSNELSSLGFFNERCKMVLLEPRITENTSRLGLDTLVSDPTLVEYMRKHSPPTPELGRAYRPNRDSEQVDVHETYKDAASIRVNPQTVSKKKMLERQLDDRELTIDEIQPGTFEYVSAKVGIDTQSILRWYEDLNLIESIQQTVEAKGIPFRWMLIDNRKKELSHLRMTAGKVTKIFDRMLLTKPVQDLISNGKTPFNQVVDPTWMCNCGHFSELGNQIIAERYITPAIKTTLNKFPRSKK